MRFRNRSSERWNNLPRSHRWWDQGRIWTQAGLRPEPTLFLFPNATAHTNTTTPANAAGLCGVCCCITDIICHQYPSIFPHLGVQPARLQSPQSGKPWPLRFSLLMYFLGLYATHGNILSQNGRRLELGKALEIIRIGRKPLILKQCLPYKVLVGSWSQRGNWYLPDGQLANGMNGQIHAQTHWAQTPNGVITEGNVAEKVLHRSHAMTTLTRCFLIPLSVWCIRLNLNVKGKNTFLLMLYN